jgi:hypothetical protein
MGSIRHTPPGKRLDAIILGMQAEGFTVSIASPTHSSEVPLIPHHLLPINPLLHKSAMYSDDGTETEVDEGSRSGSSGDRLVTPESKDNTRALRPTASAPPRSDGWAKSGTRDGDYEGGGKAIKRADTPSADSVNLLDLLSD